MGAVRGGGVVPLTFLLLASVRCHVTAPSQRAPPRPWLHPWAVKRGGSTASRPSGPKLQPPSPALDDEGVFTIARGFTALCDTMESSSEGDGVSTGAEGDGGSGKGRGSGKLGPGDAAVRYAVVAILGCQASGKSTLLNHLFGTQFPVLDQAARGIQVGADGVALAGVKGPSHVAG
jgi:hypothetical protein